MLAEDNYCELAELIVTVRGERAFFFNSSSSNINSDLFFSFWGSDARVESFKDAMSPDVRAAVQGYAAGVNRYVRDTGVSSLPVRCKDGEWVRPIDEDDMVRVFIRLISLASTLNFSTGTHAVPPAPVIAGVPPQPTPDPSKFSPEAIRTAMAVIEREGPIGSNAVALGSDTTHDGRGLLLVNPHFPWRGTLRFYQMHVTIPDVLDSMGAAIFGSPIPNIAFNRDVAWSHTVSTAARFVLRELKLDPADPTAYLVDGVSRPMQPVPVSITVRDANGTVRTVDHTFYDTEFGFVIALPPILSWSATTAFAIQDANKNNFRIINQYLAMNQANGVESLERALEENIGLPWVNTIAVDRHGDAYYADIGAMPHVTDAQLTDCAVFFTAAVKVIAGVDLLDGSTSACRSGTDPGSPEPGIFGPSHLPSIHRSDYVQNSNDSYWLANPAEPLEGFPSIIGAERNEQGFRTRLGNIQIEEFLASGALFEREDVLELVYGNRNLSAELALAAVLSVCTPAPAPIVVRNGQPVDLTAICAALAGWDGRQNLDSRGAHVWRQFWPGFVGSGGPSSVFSTPFDPNDPVHTPRDVDLSAPTVVKRLLDELADATLAVQSLGVPLDATLGEVQFEEHKGERIPIHGGPGSHGVYNAIGTRTRNGAGYAPITSGTSILQVVDFQPHRVQARAVLTYSESTDPDNPHFADQTRLFSDEGWNDLPFTPGEISQDPEFQQIQIQETIPETVPAQFN
ncbi:MAG: acylase [bacterium]|nr:acylase [bacterium]